MMRNGIPRPGDGLGHVTPFSTFEEAQQIMQDAEEVANASLTLAQKAVGYGNFWWSWRPDFGDLFIFGECWTLKTIEQSERMSGSGDNEWEYQRRMMEDSYRRGYRFGMAYSVMEPEGELGSTHIANMLGAITYEEFRHAKAHNFAVDNECLQGFQTATSVEEMRRLHSECLGCACICHVRMNAEYMPKEDW